jgi:membrane protein DedA with SNARE-associated domain
VLEQLMDHFPAVAPWGYVLVFAAAAAEAALFVGLVFPGETVLLLAGFMAWRGDGNLVGYMAAGTFGAIAGDSIGYELGRRFGPRLRRSGIGRRLGEHRWERAEEFMRSKGGRAVFLARFVAFVKTIVPALAGQARLPYARFLVWNAAGAAVWGPLHVGLGYLAGESYQHVERYLGTGGWVLLGLVTVGGLVYWRWHGRQAGGARSVLGARRQAAEQPLRRR